MDLLKRTTIAIIAVILTNMVIFTAESSASSYGLLKGRVLDNERNPLTGATIKVEDSRLGTITDAEGEFIFQQMRVDSILRKHNVDMYICGHIHNFQHIRKEDSDIDYIVNTSGSLSREVQPIDGTVFCNGKTGISFLSVSKKALKLNMIDNQGNIIHSITRHK